MQFTSRAEPGPRVYSAPSEAVKVLRRPPSESTRRPERCRARSTARVRGRTTTVAQLTLPDDSHRLQPDNSLMSEHVLRSRTCQIAAARTPSSPLPDSSRSCRKCANPMTCGIREPGLETSIGKLLLASLLGALLFSCVRTEQAPGEILIRTGSFSFPSLASILPAIIKSRELDRRNGIRLEVQSYGNVASYYAALVSGEVDTIPGGPLILQRMRNEGVPAVITNTYAGLESLLVISRDPSISNLPALNGRRLAADMASSEFQILRLIAQERGLMIAQDVEVIQAVPSVARAHLESGEADAMLTFEPAATLALRTNENYHVVAQGSEGWSGLGRGTAWLLVSSVREDWIERHSGRGVEAWRRTLASAARMISESPEESDAIVSESLRIPRGTFLTAVESNRIHIEILYAEEAPVLESLRTMFQFAVDTGFADQLPDDGLVYTP